MVIILLRKAEWYIGWMLKITHFKRTFNRSCIVANKLRRSLDTSAKIWYHRGHTSTSTNQRKGRIDLHQSAIRGSVRTTPPFHQFLNRFKPLLTKATNLQESSMKENVTYNLKKRVSPYDYKVTVDIKTVYCRYWRKILKVTDEQRLFWTEGHVVSKLSCFNKQLNLSFHIVGILFKDLNI